MFTRFHIFAALILSASVTGLAQSGVDFRDAVKATTPAIVAVTLGLKGDDGSPIMIGSSGPYLSRYLFRYTAKAPKGEMRLTTPGSETKPMRSGFAVAADLVISWNVPGEASQIVMVAHDGRRLTGRVVARDHVTDLAAIRIEQGSLNGLTLKETAPEAGLPVLVSWVRDAKTVTSDASMIATNPNSDESRFGFSQRLDGDFTPQTSGAPVVDAGGRVVGVLVASNSGATTCLSPICVARLIETASANEARDLQRGRIGIHMDGEENAAVTLVGEETPAQDAGVEVGDRVTRVGDFACRNPSDVMAAVAMYRAGDEVAFEIQRGDDTISRVIKLTANESKPKPKAHVNLRAGETLLQLKDGRLVQMDEKDKESSIGKALLWLNQNNQQLKKADVVVPLEIDGLNGRVTLQVERSRMEDSLKKLEAQKAKQDELNKQLREQVARMEAEAKARQDREVARLQELVEEIKERIQSERLEK